MCAKYNVNRGIAAGPAPSSFPSSSSSLPHLNLYRRFRSHTQHNQAPTDTTAEADSPAIPAPNAAPNATTATAQPVSTSSANAAAAANPSADSTSPSPSAPTQASTQSSPSPSLTGTAESDGDSESGTSSAATSSHPFSVPLAQKVRMYSKLLRVLQSPTKGKTPNTAGDDYVLSQTETQSLQSQFPGLINANLRGVGGRKRGGVSGLKVGRAYAVGGRKAAKARVWIQPAMQRGTGDFYVNGRRYVDYFQELDQRWELCAPFHATGTLTHFDMLALVSGGGFSGQAGAIKNAAAKALQKFDRARYRPLLKKQFLLSRDPRAVERKKYGQKKARKKFAFVKR